MDIQAVLIVAAVFLCILVLPAVYVLKLSGDEKEEKESPKQEVERIRKDERYPAVRDSEQVAEMAALVRSIPDVMRATLREDGFRLERKIDRIGETERIRDKEILFSEPMTMEQMNLVRCALEEVLEPEYLTTQIMVGKKKEQHCEGYYIFLDPNITGKLVEERTKEAIYNGERTGDL